MTLPRLIAVVFFSLLAVLSAAATRANAQPSGAVSDDWPQWRGPTRDGQTAGDAWPDSLGEDRLERQWRVELGPSYSGPIVVGSRVFTTETRGKQTEVVTAFDRNSGKELWRAEWPGSMTVPFFAAANGSWIRATPACDGRTLFVPGINDVLVALDAATGEERWRVDFPKDHNAAAPKFGCASSPLIHNGFVYAQMGGGFAKVDAETGELAWLVAQDGGGMSGGAFSSPQLTDEFGETIALVQTRSDLKGIRLDSGEELWSQPIQAFRGMNILTPVAYRGQLFTSAHTGASQLWRVADGGGLEELWRNKSQAYMSSPVVVGEHLYLHLKNQRLQCLNLATGEEAWRSKPFGKYQSMVTRGDLVLALDASGKLILFRATPEEFDVLDTRQISQDETWAHVAVCGGQVFVRELNALAVYRWE